MITHSWRSWTIALCPFPSPAVVKNRNCDMAHELKQLKFTATPEKGEVSALFVRPKNASHLLVLAHGASTNMRHATLQTIAERLADAGIATLRYNFPYSEHGKGRDSQEVCTTTVR